MVIIFFEKLKELSIGIWESEKDNYSKLSDRFSRIWVFRFNKVEGEDGCDRLLGEVIRVRFYFLVDFFLLVNMFSCGFYIFYKLIFLNIGLLCYVVKRGI